MDGMQVAGDGLPTDPRATADLLAQRHFVLQDRRPGHLSTVDLITLDSSLRSLLFTDGTVTRTLEVQALSPVSVEVKGQRRTNAAGPIAEHLEVPAGTDAIERRVVIGVDGSPGPSIWAESHIVPDRLPASFLGVLDDSPDGIGESLQQVRLESWRELLWFGLDLAPEWSHPAASERPTVLQRLYRVINQDRPAILIAESFAIERSAGRYHLAA